LRFGHAPLLRRAAPFGCRAVRGLAQHGGSRRVVLRESLLESIEDRLFDDASRAGWRTSMLGFGMISTMASTTSSARSTTSGGANRRMRFTSPTSCSSSLPSTTSSWV
jgi:hypothetical protein